MKKEEKSILKKTKKNIGNGWGTLSLPESIVTMVGMFR